MFEQLGLIGCGLMGGSFALAMKKAGLVQRVVIELDRFLRRDFVRNDGAQQAHQFQRVLGKVDLAPKQGNPRPGLFGT